MGKRLWILTACALLAVASVAGDEPDGSTEPFVAGQDGVTTPIVRHETKTHISRPADTGKREARVILRVTVLKDGSVSDVETTSCVHRKKHRKKYEAEPKSECLPFEQAARQAVREWKYEPATKAGVPVDAHYVLVVEWDAR